ncbi:MAG: HlyD family efflux transporter periplasmic adaptor subunit [Thermodesulfobacteriota bacterium]
MPEIVPQPLREELRIRKQTLHGEVCYVVKEPEAQAYFRFDEGQYGMLASFDGKTALARLVDVFNARSEEYEYDLDSARSLHTAARANKLLKRTRDEEQAALRERLRETRKQKFMQRQGSLLFMRFHVYDPDALFDRLAGPLAFFWRPAFVRLCMLFMLSALALTVIEGQRFAHDFLAVSAYVFGSLAGFLTAWPLILVVIALHEFAHGLTCKHFGGEVHDMGLLLMVLINPCMYCNINDAWLFENKRHKIFTVMAGIYFELLLGSVAVYVWYFTEVNTLAGMLAFVVITVCISATVLFNLNPLMKLDGYYLLADWLEMPNLRQNSLAWLSYSLKRVIFRLKEEPPLYPTPRESRLFLVYGALMVAYLGTVFGKIGQMGYGALSHALGVAGVLLFAFIACKLLGKMLGSWPATLGRACGALFWKGRRRRATQFGLLALFVALFVATPRMRVSAPCTVDSDVLVVHAPEAGFVAEAAFGPDRRLSGAPGSTLLALSSPDLALAAAQLAAKEAILDQERRLAGAEREGAALRRLNAREASLDAEAASLEKRQRALTIPAPPGSWTVDGPPRETLIGRFFPQGAPILTLASARTRMASVTLDQADLEDVAPGHAARVLLAGALHGPLEGVVERIAPVAQKQGAQQRFEVRVRLEQVQGRALPPLGLTGQALILGQPRPLWRHVWRHLKAIVRFDLWL